MVLSANGEAERPLWNNFNEKMESFLKNVKEVNAMKNCPTWFGDFSNYLETFVKDIANTTMELESKLAVQKAVTDGLVTDRRKLQSKVIEIEEELEDQQ